MAYAVFDHTTLTSWLKAFEAAVYDGHTTTSFDDVASQHIGWRDETLNQYHRVGLKTVMSYRTTEPHLGNLGWLRTTAERINYLTHPRIPALHQASGPTDPDLTEAHKLLGECGGSMAQENLPEAGELISGGWAKEGPVDQFGRRTVVTA